MTIRLQDTMSGETRPLEPIEPGLVRIYSCGPTVYGPAPPTRHGSTPDTSGPAPLATAALGLFLPIEQSGITSGLSHDR